MNYRTEQMWSVESHAEMNHVHWISRRRIYILLGQAFSKSKSLLKKHERDVILPAPQPTLLSNSVGQDLINNRHSLIKILKSFKSHLMYPKAEVYLCFNISHIANNN